MERRRFMHCVGGSCVLAICGCAVHQSDKGYTMLKHEPATDHVNKSDWDISVCGLNCARCKLKEQGRCGGCRGPVEQNWSPKCKFRPCAAEKGHRYCFECDDFMCDRLEAFATDGHEHHRLAVENMKTMRDMGIEEWIAQQPKPMFCAGWLF